MEFVKGPVKKGHNDQNTKESSVMLDHLNHSKIKESPVKIDETMLNTALEAIGIHGFLNKRICGITIGEVYDGTNIKPEILINEKKVPVKTSDELKDMLMTYIDYLNRHLYSVNPDDLLFSWYAGSSGEKKLRRHIGKYSIYSDTNELKKKCRENIDRELAAAGKDRQQRINEIADASGKSSRAINKSLRPPSQQSDITSKNKDTYGDIIKEALESNDPNFCNTDDRFLRLWDQICVLPELVALDEKKCEILITIVFAYIDSAFSHNKDSDRNLTKCHFVRDLQERVNEIEKDLFEKRKKVKEIKVLKDEPAKHIDYVQLLTAALEEYESQKNAKATSEIQTQPVLSSEFKLSDEQIAEKIDELYVNILRVKKETFT